MTAPPRPDALDTARRVIDHEIDALQRMRDAVGDAFQRAVDLILERPGRVIVTGLGKSGIIGRKIAATLASTGTASYFLHASEGLHGDLGVVHRDDVVICLSKSGNTDELTQLIPVFERLGAPVIAITSNPDSPLARHSAVTLPLAVREEACPHDLAPTSSTTAMLVLGDALAIALLERRGFRREDYAFLHPAGSLGKRLLLRVEDIMETGDRIAWAPPTAVMRDAVLLMASRRGICAIVDDEMRVHGVVTTGDLNRLVKRVEHFFPVPVTEVMNRRPKLIERGALAYTAYNLMEEHRVIAMPVVDAAGRLVGVIHLHDVMRAGIF